MSGEIIAAALGGFSAGVLIALVFTGRTKEQEEAKLIEAYIRGLLVGNRKS